MSSFRHFLFFNLHFMILVSTIDAELENKIKRPFNNSISAILGVISILKQLEYFKDYKRKLETAIGKERTKTLISMAAFIVSAGTNDFVVNYFGTPFRSRNYDIATYQQFLLQNVQQFIQKPPWVRPWLPPIGCMPIVITVTSGEANGQRRCVDSLSTVALDYNQKLQNKLTAMDNSSSSAIYYADIYQPLNDMIQTPSQFVYAGFENVNCGCCGSGLVETTFMCDSRSSVCKNPSKYVFFDSVHPTEAAYSGICQMGFDRIFLLVFPFRISK
ncbi:PREDICTED: GDSL esterase/lipase At5g45960-like [Erythranthe guttata]|uniref:GDSL esterase/lipase At5g45960-like n=1 Tax=Erythranthe guttata TaxID=4155 RepID=UPI00064DEA2B|nr:PREDICTED: GDSL esterase/lipase At5g45960-like [Erythranthe guttata]|eukprot:XP_012830470.1 PREDICTED: GDSL esterase/lipase At5g45960-like [Erythranthe guttata]